MLKELLISEVRINILRIMLPIPTKQYHVRALVRAVGAEINAVRRELNRLVGIGLLRRRQSSNRLYHTVNTDSIYYPELLALIAKEMGLGADIIKHAKELGDVRFAVLSKAFLRGRKPSVLDVDLFLVGSVNLPVLKKIVVDAERSLDREINYTVMNSDEFLHRKRRNDQFVAKFLTQSRTMLIGDEEEFCSI